MRTPSPLDVTLLALCGALACGGGGGSSNAPTSPTAPTTPTTPATPSATDVTVQNNSFAPAALTVRAFNTPGTYKYHCSIHGTAMSGSVVVQ